MTRTLYGKVHGKTIELEEDLGVVDGQEVEVQVTMLKPKKKLPGPPPGWQPGNTKTTAGLLADLCTEDDEFAFFRKSIGIASEKLGGTIAE